MDLGTIRKNLLARKYQKAAMALRDIKQVWDNSRLFYPVHSKIVIDANTLEMEVDKVIHSLPMPVQILRVGFMFILTAFQGVKPLAPLQYPNQTPTLKHLPITIDKQKPAPKAMKSHAPVQKLTAKHPSTLLNSHQPIDYPNLNSQADGARSRMNPLDEGLEDPRQSKKARFSAMNGAPTNAPINTTPFQVGSMSMQHHEGVKDLS